MNFIKKLIGILLLIVTQLSAKIDGQRVGCGGTYSNLSGIISSPNYPSNYDNYLYCTYYIQVPSPNSVNISFISFAMQSCCDWLKVSCTSGSTKSAQSFSGTNLPPFLSISSCYTVQLLFYTDSSGVAQGFSLRYDIGNGLEGGLTMKPMNIYVRNDSTEPIVLSCSSRANQPDVYPWWSYNFNDNRYDEILTMSNCSVSSSLWSLNSSYFSTTRQYPSRTCNLTISRSSFPSTTGIYTCTDSTLDFFNALITDCGGMHTGLSGIISSPNYPSNYGNNMDCVFYIQVSPPYSVNITFISFATESCCDYLQVSCSSDSTKPIQRFSGTNVPTFLSISSCYNVQLLFHTDSSAVHQGFSLRYDIENAGTGSSLDSAQLLFHTNGLVVAQGFSLRYDTGNETGNNNLNTLALIVGVVLGSVLLIVVAIVMFFCLRRKRIPKTHPSPATNVDPQNDNLYEMFRRNTQHANEGENSTYETLKFDKLE